MIKVGDKVKITRNAAKRFCFSHRKAMQAERNSRYYTGFEERLAACKSGSVGVVTEVGSHGCAVDFIIDGIQVYIVIEKSSLNRVE